MNPADTLSPTAKAGLHRLLVNERANRLTHRTAMHQATRESLIGRGLVEWEWNDAHLRLTDEGRAMAERLASKTWVGGVDGP